MHLEVSFLNKPNLLAIFSYPEILTNFSKKFQSLTLFQTYIILVYALRLKIFDY